MDRLCPTMAALFLLFLACSGCTGQNLEGAWEGPFPFEGATDCRTRLTNSGKFDLTCKGDPEWVGMGRYDRSGDSLRFRFQALTRRGIVVERPPEVQIDFEGQGNRMRLSEPRGLPFFWQRLPM